MVKELNGPPRPDAHEPAGAPASGSVRAARGQHVLLHGVPSAVRPDHPATRRLARRAPGRRGGDDLAPSRERAAVPADLDPEIHRVGGAWYVYYAAAPDATGKADPPSTNETFNHRVFVLENTAADPFEGEWGERGQVDTGGEPFALDAATLEPVHRSDGEPLDARRSRRRTDSPRVRVGDPRVLGERGPRGARARGHAVPDLLRSRHRHRLRHGRAHRERRCGSAGSVLLDQE